MLATMVPEASSSGIVYTRARLEQKYSRHSSFSGAREGGACEVDILVSAKYSTELLKLHPHAPRKPSAAERRGDRLLYFQRSRPRRCHRVQGPGPLTPIQIGRGVHISYDLDTWPIQPPLFPFQFLCKSSLSDLKNPSGRRFLTPIPWRPPEAMVVNYKYFLFLLCLFVLLCFCLREQNLYTFLSCIYH